MVEHKRFVLWGSSGHAKVLADVVSLSGGEVVALFDNNEQAVSCLPGVPLYYGDAGFIEWKNNQDSSDTFYAALAIGGQKGEDRKNIAQYMESSGLTFPNLIHPSAIVSSTAHLGKGCQILANSTVAADVTMGSFSIVNNSASVDHECMLGVGVHLAPGAIICGDVNINDFAMIGAGAVVLPRLSIGKRVVVGAGAVVTKDIPDDAVVVGNPARILRKSK